MSTNADGTDLLVSDAVVAFTGWGSAKTPRADAAAVDAYARTAGTAPEPLLDAVHAAIAASDAIDMSGVDLESAAAGPEYKARLRASQPQLSDAAIDALASRWFYRRLWLGEGTPLVSSGSTPRYFALFARQGSERVPRALFRRRESGGAAVDEVLRDVDRWETDASGRVDRAITRYLDSDLEEISPQQADEFLAMVARREYRPFTSR